MVWKTDGSLKCDTCPATYDVGGPRVEVLYHARAHGWHLFQGMNYTGDRPMDSHLCEDCVGKATTRLPAPKQLDGEQTLFDVKPSA
jgi:hypothetical protein